MPPKKARVRLRQSKVFFPCGYQAFAVVLSSRFSIDVDRVILISDKAWRSSTLYASIILVSEELYLPIINDCDRL